MAALNAILAAPALFLMAHPALNAIGVATELAIAAVVLAVRRTRRNTR